MTYTNNMKYNCENNNFSQIQKQPPRGILKICSKFTGEHPYRSVISIKMLHIFRTPFYKNTYGGLLLQIYCTCHTFIK